MGDALTDRALAIVNFVEQKFWTNGGIPTYEVIAKGTGETVKYVAGILEKNALARKALVVRGVDLRPRSSAETLTGEQLMAANVMLNVHDKRSEREKLNFLGISSQKWHGWRRQPAFSNYLSSRAEAAFEADDFKAFQSLSKSVEDGDLNAVKFHFEMRGRYKNTLDVNVNIEGIMTQMIEIVAKHVRDPNTIVAIANELEQLELGEGTPTQQALGAVVEEVTPYYSSSDDKPDEETVEDALEPAPVGNTRGFDMF